MNTTTQYHGRCFCGAVQFTLTGEPEAMAYCHCESCRRWSAAPVSAFTLWDPVKLTIIKGKENTVSFSGNPLANDESVYSERKWCRSCGGHIFTVHPKMQLVDVPSAVIESLSFKPAFHVHYQEKVLPINDGLPKFKDLPAGAGGSDEKLDE